MNEEDANQRFIVAVNIAMATALKEGANPDVLAKVCLNTALEMYKHYGAGEDADNFLEYVVATEFEVAEIEDWLDDVEGDEKE